jgi:hypothetical protein
MGNLASKNGLWLLNAYSNLKKKLGSRDSPIKIRPMNKSWFEGTMGTTEFNGKLHELKKRII